MDYVTIILNAAKISKVSGPILLAICMHESNLNNVIVENDGGTPSAGICQIKLETAKMFHYRGDIKGLMDPKTNATYAAKYLKYQYKRYHNWMRSVAAFNAGKYNPSQIVPGCPRNLKYIVKIRKILENNVKDSKEQLKCDVNYAER